MSNQQANKDDNSVSTLLGVLKTDGQSTIRIKGNSSNGGIKASINGVGTNMVSVVAKKDDNDVSTMMLVSSTDGTNIAVAADSSGNILMETV